MNSFYITLYESCDSNKATMFQTYILDTWFIENIGIQTGFTGVRWHVLNRSNVIINVLWTIKR